MLEATETTSGKNYHRVVEFTDTESTREVTKL